MDSATTISATGRPGSSRLAEQQERERGEADRGRGRAQMSELLRTPMQQAREEVVTAARHAEQGGQLRRGDAQRRRPP